MRSRFVKHLIILFISFWAGSTVVLYAVDKEQMGTKLDAAVYHSLAQELSVRSKFIIDNEFGLDQLALRVDMSHLVDKLSEGTFVPFDYAVRMALESFLTDGKDDESPLRIAKIGFFKKNKHAKIKEKFGFNQDSKVQQFLREKLQQGDATLSLVSDDGLQGRPERGESTEYAWVFELTVPGLSDHIYWAVVDLDGYQPTYNYGFN